MKEFEKYAQKVTPLMKEVFKAWKAGYRDPEEIAERINAKISSVRSALWKLRKAGVITEISAFQMLERSIKSSYFTAKMALDGHEDKDEALRRIMTLMNIALKHLNTIRKYYLIVNPRLARRKKK